VHFHFIGGELNPSTLKLEDFSQILESITPMIMSLSECDLSTDNGKPIKSHDLVVRSCLFSLGKTNTTSSCSTTPIFLVNKYTNIN